MSKLDWFTILVIAVCVLAIGALIWNAKNLWQDSKSNGNPEISEDYVDPSADDTDEYEINIDGDADGDDAPNDAGGISDGNNSTIQYDTDRPEADAEEARIAQAEAEAAAAAERERRNGAVSERINTNTSPSNGNDAAGTNPARTRAVSSQDVPTGNYMVLIGSYTQRVSAERMRAQLKAKGYRNARIEYFNGTKYARVLVGHDASRDSALDLQAELMKDGFRDILIMRRK